MIIDKPRSLQMSVANVPAEIYPYCLVKKPPLF